MFKAAFYETELTPPLGYFLPGGGNRYATDVRDKVYAKAVVISNDKETIATVVLDCVTMPSFVHDVVVKRVTEYTPIKPENITVCCNHTHEGVPMRGNVGVGIPDPDGYIDVVMRLMADCITLAYRRLQPVKIKYACGNVDGIAFNRNWVMNDGTIATNIGRDNMEPTPYNVPDDIPVYKFSDVHKSWPREVLNKNVVGNLAGVDTSLPLLVFENEEGKPIGSIINFACHQTCLSGDEVSGDYSSVLSKELKKTYGSDFVSLFIIGTAGDINHVDPTIDRLNGLDSYFEMGKKIADESRRLFEIAKEIKGDTIAAKKEKLVIDRRPVTRDMIAKEAKHFVDGKKKSHMNLAILLRYVTEVEASGEKTMDVYVQTIRIGDVYFYALPGEVYVDFGFKIKEKSPSSKVLITELANAPTGGYIATKEAFGPTSYTYETVMAGNTCLVPEAGYIITDKALEQAKELKNKN